MQIFFKIIEFYNFLNEGMIATTSSTDKSHAVQGLPVISCLLTFPSDFYHEEGRDFLMAF